MSVVARLGRGGGGRQGWGADGCVGFGGYRLETRLILWRGLGVVLLSLLFSEWGVGELEEVGERMGD